MWQVIFHPAVTDWFNDLPIEDQNLMQASVDLLKEAGPALKRPQVGKIAGSKIKNLKELRPGSKGSSEIRVLFAFDKKRHALFLVAGDKKGEWNRWYVGAIELAEKRYEEIQDGN